MADRFTGPPRTVTIRPRLPLWQWAGCMLVAALIGFWLAVGHS